MRFFLNLLALVALLVASLAAPAAATAAVQQQSEADCAEMDMAKSEHEMPAGERRSGEACCIAVSPAITPPLAALDVAASIDHPVFVVKAEPFHLGAGPQAEDPPPRIA